LAEAFFGPLQRDFVIAGVGLHPVAIIIGAPAEHFLAHHRNSQDVMDEMHDLGPGQAAQIAVDDDPVEALIYKSEQIAERPSNAGRASGRSKARDFPLADEIRLRL